MASRSFRTCACLALLAAAACGAEPLAEQDQGALVSNRDIDGRALPPRTVTLTYDDGPTRASMLIAEFLEAEGIKATFFVHGCSFDDVPTVERTVAAMGAGLPAHQRWTASASCTNPNRPVRPQSDLRRLIELGHRVANHTYSGPNLGGAPWRAQPEVSRANRIIAPWIEDDVHMLRVPGGDYNRFVARELRRDPSLTELNGAVGWDVPIRSGAGYDYEAFDYACLGRLGRSPRYCADRIFDNLELAHAQDPSRGHVIMLHDYVTEFTYASGRPSDIEARAQDLLTLTRRLVTRIRGAGYTFVPLDAVPGLMGRRRFIEDRPVVHHREFGDGVGWGVNESYWGSLAFADTDGDGALEVCGRGNAGVKCMHRAGGRFTVKSVWSPAFSDAEGFEPASYGGTLMFGRLDRDADDDACARLGDGVYCSTDHRSTRRWTRAFSDPSGFGARPSYWRSLRLADVTGDGLADLCGRGPTGLLCATNTGGGFGGLRHVSSALADRHASAERYGATLQFGDVTGDGRLDVCWRTREGITCAKNQAGRHFGASRLWIRGPFSDEDGFTDKASWASIRLADMNGDGVADVCGRAPTGVVCAFSDGRNFVRYLYLMNRGLRDADGYDDVRRGSTLMVGDFSGDGAGDMCARGVNGLECAHGNPRLRAP